MITLLATGTNLSAIIIPIISTILTASVLFVLRWGWVQLQKNLNEGRSEMVSQIAAIKADGQTQMDRIEETLKTNAEQLTLHATQFNDYDKRLIRQEAKTELLTEIYLNKNAAP